MKCGDSFDVSRIDSPTAPVGGIMNPWNVIPLIHCSFTADFSDVISDEYTQFFVLRLYPFQNGFGIGVKRNVSHIHIEFGYHSFH